MECRFSDRSLAVPRNQPGAGHQLQPHLLDVGQFQADTHHQEGMLRPTFRETRIEHPTIWFDLDLLCKSAWSHPDALYFKAAQITFSRCEIDTRTAETSGAA